MPDMPLTLLRWTRFASDPHGTGPEKRSTQIRALAEEAGFAIDDMRPPTSLPQWRTWVAGLAAHWRFGPHASVDRAGVGLLGYRSLFYRTALARHCGVRVLLWETTYDTVLPTLARRAGFRVIALPHNLEALVSGAVFADPAYDPTADLGAEVRRLALADAVFTIAKEERWLLEARGLAPGYLPYYPDPALVTECHAIRARRVARASTDGRVHGPLLILGSAFNPATARGMAQQLEWLAQSPATNAEVIVAGPQSDVLLARYARPAVQLLGSVTREKLIALLEHCSALLIHTFGGAGAVTRIPEALLAGVPIIANPNAARDQFGTPGLHLYESTAELIAQIAACPPIPPAPAYPASAVAEFRSTLVRLVNSTLP
jgi:hypothetical protein